MRGNIYQRTTTIAACGSAMAMIGPQSQAVSGPQIWHWVVFVLILVALLVFLLPPIARWQRRCRRRSCYLQLENVGNVPDVYLLRAEDTVAGLLFQFTLGGQPLPTIALGGEASAFAPEPTRAVVSAPRLPKSPPGLSSIGRLGGMGAFWGEMFTTLGHALPEPVGSPLVRAGKKLSEGRRVAAQVQHGPRELQTWRQVSRRFHPSAVQRTAPAPKVSAPPGPLATCPVIWARTPALAPGERLELELQLFPVHPESGGAYHFTVISRAEDEAAAPVTVEGQCRLPPLTIFERYGPFLALATLPAVLLMLFLSLFG